MQGSLSREGFNLVICSLQTLEWLDHFTALITCQLVEKHLELTLGVSNNLTKRSVKRGTDLGTDHHDF